MMKLTITIEHNGTQYRGQIATIKSTHLGDEDHGILTTMIHLAWDGAGVGFGGYCLDAPRKDDSGKFLGRVGTAYGLDHLMRIMETVGVDGWEHLPGRQVIALFDDANTWGAKVKGIAGMTTGKVFIPEEHAAEWTEA
jgi:hypothetical protein